MAESPRPHLIQHLPDDARLSRPVSPTMRKCLFSALRGMRSGRFPSLVVMPMPSPATALLNGRLPGSALSAGVHNAVP